jgi:hypothetical protein
VFWCTLSEFLTFYPWFPVSPLGNGYARGTNQDHRRRMGWVVLILPAWLASQADISLVNRRPDWLSTSYCLLAP